MTTDLSAPLSKSSIFEGPAIGHQRYAAPIPPLPHASPPQPRRLRKHGTPPSPRTCSPPNALLASKALHTHSSPPSLHPPPSPPPPSPPPPSPPSSPNSSKMMHQPPLDLGARRSHEAAAIQAAGTPPPRFSLQPHSPPLTSLSLTLQPPPYPSGHRSPGALSLFIPYPSLRHQSSGLSSLPPSFSLNATRGTSQINSLSRIPRPGPNRRSPFAGAPVTRPLSEPSRPSGQTRIHLDLGTAVLSMLLYPSRVAYAPNFDCLEGGHCLLTTRRQSCNVRHS